MGPQVTNMGQHCGWCRCLLSAGRGVLDTPRWLLRPVPDEEIHHFLFPWLVLYPAVRKYVSTTDSDLPEGYSRSHVRVNVLFLYGLTVFHSSVSVFHKLSQECACSIHQTKEIQTLIAVVLKLSRCFLELNRYITDELLMNWMCSVHHQKVAATTMVPAQRSDINRPQVGNDSITTWLSWFKQHLKK